jgi:hypothetical protein
MTEMTSTRYIVREIDGKFAVEAVEETKHQAAFWTRAGAEAYAKMRNEMRAKEAGGRS